ncbi:MAG: 1-acyl-sn-glycerol-3-phosphate acyltransferase [Paracoccaceae bacterium]
MAALSTPGKPATVLAMFRTVSLPLWLLVLILAFAAVTFASHFLFPSVRWFFRRRMERVVARLNERLDRPIQPFKLMQRQDMIARLIHDPKVMEAVVEQARETGAPENVAFHEARTYAREIVPGFSATLYFGFATRAAKALSKLLYDVRVGRFEAEEIGEIDPDATVIFVMNHRSNMDYVLVTWLVARRSALSYAVGEWARVWPLSRLIRAMGAYFIRRGSRNTLYRRVLARYVQMATEAGVTQAVFPEGGLSLDGRVGSARMGLLSYILAGYRPGESRDVVFIPVGIAYDRVVEDRLLTEAHVTGVRRFRARPLAILGFLGRTLWRMLRGRFPGFGRAGVSFGKPLSLAAFMAQTGRVEPEALGARLMADIAAVVPALPVPLVAALCADGPVPRADLTNRLTALMARLSAMGVSGPLTPVEQDEALREGLRALEKRDILRESDGRLQTAPGKAALIEFYAAPIRQHLDAVAASVTPNSRQSSTNET